MLLKWIKKLQVSEMRMDELSFPATSTNEDPTRSSTGRSANAVAFQLPPFAWKGCARAGKEKLPSSWEICVAPLKDFEEYGS